MKETSSTDPVTVEATEVWKKWQSNAPWTQKPKRPVMPKVATEQKVNVVHDSFMHQDDESIVPRRPAHLKKRPHVLVLPVLNPYIAPIASQLPVQKKEKVMHSPIPQITHSQEVHMTTTVASPTSGGRSILKIILWAVLGIVAIAATDAYTDHRNAKDLEYMHSRLEQQKLQNEAEISAAQTAAMLEELKAKKAQPATVASVTYACDSVESVQAGYRKHVVHNIGEVSSSPIRKCMWLSADLPVSNITGSGYILEWPYPADPSQSYKCPSAQVTDCAKFLNALSSDPQFLQKEFRVILTTEGHINITTAKRS